MNHSGADIKFLGKRSIKITGVKELINGKHNIIGDRIEAFSYLCVGVATNGKIKVKKINPTHLRAEINILKKIGCKISVNENSILTIGIFEVTIIYLFSKSTILNKLYNSFSSIFRTFCEYSQAESGSDSSLAMRDKFLNASVTTRWSSLFSSS